MEDKYDVIVVGGGIAGLVCATTLAKRKAKVLLIEKNKGGGGCCSSINFKGGRYDIGAHCISNCAHGDILYKILSYLGVNIKFSKFEPTDRVFIDSKAFEIDENYENKLMTMFPAEKKNLELYFNESRKIYTSIMSNNQKSLKEYEALYFLQYLKMFFSDSRLIELLSSRYGFVGTPREKISLLSALMIIESYTKGGGYYPNGGANVIGEMLKLKYLTYSGEVSCSKKVIEILTPSNISLGVRCSDGSVLMSKHIVACYSVHSVLDAITNIEFKEVNIKKIGTFVLSSPFIVMFVKVTARVENIKKMCGWHFVAEHGRSRFINIFCQSCFDNTLGSLNSAIVKVTVEVFQEEKTKDEWKRVIGNMERYIKCFFKKTNLQLDGFQFNLTPSYFEGLTGNRGGAAYGWQQWPGQVFNNRQYYLPKNLSLAGHWTNPGAGIAAVALSGYQKAVEIMRLCRYGE